MTLFNIAKDRKKWQPKLKSFWDLSGWQAYNREMDYRILFALVFMKYVLLLIAGIVTVVGLPLANSQAQQNCDPAYPTICIPPPPPDLDCKDIGYTSFEVRSPDPHHFDGDEDGIGCEPPPYSAPY